MKRSLWNRITAILILLCGFIVFTGCRGNKTIVLTAGFAEDEVFKIDSAVCTKPEVMVYMVNIRNTYETIYGEEIWDTDASGISIKDSVKETVLARISKVKVLCLMAEEREISLSQDEEIKTKVAAKDYYQSLSDKEKEFLSVDEESLASMYRDYALAQKVYDTLVYGINPEISDDDARSVTVSYIKIKTYHTDINGKNYPYSDTFKKDARKRAEEVYALLGEEEFDSLILEYNEDDKSQCSIRKGETDPAFEEAAFNLGKDEISNVVEAEDGYYIIKVLNAYDRLEADANKKAIIRDLKEKTFEDAYESFLSGLTGNLNEELWDGLDFPDDPEIKTHSFFSTYENYFPKESE